MSIYGRHAEGVLWYLAHSADVSRVCLRWGQQVGVSNPRLSVEVLGTGRASQHFELVPLKPFSVKHPVSRAGGAGGV